jgi:hypothetical protein
MNSGSTMLIFVIIFAYFFIMMALYHGLKRYASNFWVRKVAMFAEM